jgi:putative AdoMet-dependent methyltransferase
MMNEPLNLPDDFDRWAPTYDADVSAGTGEGDGRFPFDGYDRVLARVVELAAPLPGMAILELGAGTGNLTARLVETGAEVWALDYSGEMLAIARQKVPGAQFVQAGLLSDYPDALRRRYACVASTYTFHELPLSDKLTLLERLFADYLQDDGLVVVGDIGFLDAPAREGIKAAAGDAWDEEYYWLADETAAAADFLGLDHSWEQVSSCGAVLTFRRSG